MIQKKAGFDLIFLFWGQNPSYVDFYLMRFQSFRVKCTRKHLGIGSEYIIFLRKLLQAKCLLRSLSNL